MRKTKSLWVAIELCLFIFDVPWNDIDKIDNITTFITKINENNAIRFPEALSFYETSEDIKPIYNFYKTHSNLKNDEILKEMVKFKETKIDLNRLMEADFNEYMMTNHKILHMKFYKGPPLDLTDNEEKLFWHYF